MKIEDLSKVEES